MNIYFFNMLKIEIPADEFSGLTFSKLQLLDIPAPQNGFDSEINDNILLSFDNEQDAIDYTQQLDEYAETLSDHSSAEYQAATAIIKVISDDDFVQSYIQS